MYYGIFEMFKIGVGPSSSHTFGPMVAAKSFCLLLEEKGVTAACSKVRVTLFGSLSATGKGHLTDQAVVLGLCGFSPESVDLDSVPALIAETSASRSLPLNGKNKAAFDIIFSSDRLPKHENGMEFCAEAEDGSCLLSERYYSIGGGFVLREEDFGAAPPAEPAQIPFPFSTAEELVARCGESPMHEILLQNELALRPENDVLSHAKKVREVMLQGIERGLATQGNLPAPTCLARRAKDLFSRLSTGKENPNSIMVQMDWVNVFAFAVSEENGAGGRVVTAPTNGACGVIPAILAYHDRFISPLDDERALRFFLVAAAIGSLFKRNASISGAEVGCQGEIGVASAMAAAGLAALYDASPQRVCMAAEIAMEHHLGLTCDPVNGQVQIPCVERNGIAAITAIDATAMALSRTTAGARVSLDAVIETMRQTGKDMDPKYRETSCGGLARLIH